jgi:hypothetical protein
VTSIIIAVARDIAGGLRRVRDMSPDEAAVVFWAWLLWVGIVIGIVIGSKAP